MLEKNVILVQFAVLDKYSQMQCPCIHLNLYPWESKLALNGPSCIRVSSMQNCRMHLSAFFQMCEYQINMIAYGISYNYR